MTGMSCTHLLVEHEGYGKDRAGWPLDLQGSKASSCIHPMCVGNDFLLVHFHQQWTVVHGSILLLIGSMLSISDTHRGSGSDKPTVLWSCFSHQQPLQRHLRNHWLTNPPRTLAQEAVFCQMEISIHNNRNKIWDRMCVPQSIHCVHDRTHSWWPLIDGLRMWRRSSAPQQLRRRQLSAFIDIELLRGKHRRILLLAAFLIGGGHWCIFIMNKRHNCSGLPTLII